MSHVALRRVAIRMLHDARFAARVRDDAEHALAGVPLAAIERRWLAAVPPAAWTTDPARPTRVLGALAEEFPASAGRAPEQAARFLHSPEFHRAVQERGSLAECFGAYLARVGGPEVASLARLESAIARVRRAPRRVLASRAGCLRLAPWAVVLHVAQGSASALEAGRRGEVVPVLTEATETLLVLRVPAAAEVTVEELTPALAALLEAALLECCRAELLGLMRAEGADAGEDDALLDQLIADGLLV